MVVDLHVVFVASPLGQGETIEVRGSSLAEAKRAKQTLTVPLSLPKGEAPWRIGRIQFN